MTHPILEKIQVSQSGHFLIKENGQPFFWLGDTGFELFHRLSFEQAEFYFENRRQRGFNIIYAVALAQLEGLSIPNIYGHTPIHSINPLKINEPYFQDMDKFINMASSKGIYLGLFPTWGDKVDPQWEIGPAIFNASNARVYGAFLGERYRLTNNIIWILGGDRKGEGFEEIWGQMAVGIIEGTGYKPLITYHPTGKTGSSMWFHDAQWLDINMWQSGHYMPDMPNWDMILNDYNRQPIKPVLDSESNYEDHPIDPYTRDWHPCYGRFTDYDVRKQAYRSVFAGACGYTYGHHSVWQMYTPDRPPKVYPVFYWYEAMYRPGANQLIHLKNLMLSRPYLIRIPDQKLLISDPGEGADHVRATRASDGCYAFIYFPTTDKSIEVDMGKFSGPVRAWWYDPREGKSWLIGEFSNKGSGYFKSPIGGPDWVLVLDVKDNHFLEPGKVS